MTLIGAGGEKRSLRLVAEHADIWNCPTRGDIDEYRRKSRVLDEHCKAIGRDPLEIGRQVQILASTDPAETEATREHIKGADRRRRNPNRSHTTATVA